MNNTTPQSTAALVLTSPLLITANYWAGHPAIAASVWAFWGASNFVYQTFIYQPQAASTALLRPVGDSGINIAGLINLMSVETSIAACVSSCITIDHPTVTAQPLPDGRQSTIPQSSPYTPGSTLHSSYPTVTAPRMLLTPLKGLIDFLYVYCVSTTTNTLLRDDVQSYLGTASSYANEAIVFFDASIYPTLDRFRGHIFVALTVALLAYLIPLVITLWQNRRVAAVQLWQYLVSLLSGDLLARWIWRMDNPLSDTLRAIAVVVFIVGISLEPAKAAMRAMLTAIEPWSGSTTFLEIDRALETFSEIFSSAKATLQNLAIDAKSACVEYLSRFADFFLGVSSSSLATFESFTVHTKSLFLAASSSSREAFAQLALATKSAFAKYASRFADWFSVLGQYIFLVSHRLFERVRCLVSYIFQVLQATGDRACGSISRLWRKFLDIPYTVSVGVAVGLLLFCCADLRLWWWHVLVVPSVIALVSLLKSVYRRFKLREPTLQTKSPKFSPRRSPPKPMDLTSSNFELQLPENSLDFLDFASSNPDLPTAEESPMPGSWPASPFKAELTPTTPGADVPAAAKQALSGSDKVRAIQDRIRRTEEEKSRRRAEKLAEYARRVAAEEARQIAHDERVRRSEEEQARRIEEEQARHDEETRARYAAAAVAERIRREEEERSCREEEERSRREEEEQARRNLEEQRRRAAEEAARTDADRVLEDSSSEDRISNNAPRSDEVVEAASASYEGSGASHNGNETVYLGQPNHHTFEPLAQHTERIQQQSEQQQNGPLSESQHHPALSYPGTVCLLDTTPSQLIVTPPNPVQSNTSTFSSLPSNVVVPNPFSTNYFPFNAVPSTPPPVASSPEPPRTEAADLDDGDDLSSIGSIDPHDFSMLGPEFKKDSRDSDGDHEMSDPPAPEDDDVDMTDVQEFVPIQHGIPIEEDVEMELDVSPTYSPATGGPPQEQMFAINYLPQLDPSILVPEYTVASGNIPVPEAGQGFEDDMMISPDKETLDVAITDNMEPYGNTVRAETEMLFDAPAFIPVDERADSPPVYDSEDLYASPPKFNAIESTQLNPFQNSPPQITYSPTFEEPAAQGGYEEAGTYTNLTGDDVGVTGQADSSIPIDPALLLAGSATNVVTTPEVEQVEEVPEEPVAPVSNSPGPQSAPSSTFTSPDRDPNSQPVESPNLPSAPQTSTSTVVGSISSPAGPVSSTVGPSPSTTDPSSFAAAPSTFTPVPSPFTADPPSFTAGQSPFTVVPTNFAASPTAFTAGSSVSTAPKPVQRSKVSGRPLGSKSPFSYIGEAKAAHDKPERRKSQPSGRFGSSFAASKIAGGSKSAGTSRVASPTTPSAPSTPQASAVVRPKLPLSRKKFGNGVQGTRFESPTTPTIPLLADAHASFSTSASRKGKVSASSDPSSNFDDWVASEDDEDNRDDSYGTVEMQRRSGFGGSTSTETADQAPSRQVYSGQISGGEVPGGQTPGFNWEEATDDDAEGDTDDELYADGASVESEEP